MTMNQSTPVLSKVSTSSNCSATSPTLPQKTPHLPNDLISLVESTIITRNSTTTNTNTSTTDSTTPTPDWEQWWNKINQNAEVSLIFRSGIKSIMNGVFKIAAQRVYDTAVRKEKQLNLKSQTPTTANRRLGNHPKSSAHSKPQNNIHPARGHLSQHHSLGDRYFQNDRRNKNSNRYSDNRSNESNHVNVRDKPQFNNRQRIADDKLPNYHPQDHIYREGSRSLESSDKHHRNVRDGHHIYIPSRNDDESYSHSSRNNDRYYNRSRYDPYRHDENVSAYDYDHRSLASSISTKPQNGLPIIRGINECHEYSRDAYNDRHRRRSRRRSRSNSSYSGSGNNSGSKRSRHRSRSIDSYGYDRDKYVDRDRRYSDQNGDNDDDYEYKHNSRDRHRSRIGSPGKRSDYDAKLPRHATTTSSSSSNRRDRDTPYQTNVENDDERRRAGNGEAYGRVVGINNVPVTGPTDEYGRNNRHERIRYDGKRICDQNHACYSDGRDTWNASSDRNGKNRDDIRKDKLEPSDTVVSRDTMLPIIEVTTIGEVAKDAKKRDRKYSTPSPRKSRKSKHRRSSSRHQSDGSSSDNSYSSSTSTTSRPRSHHRHHHGSNSIRKRRRHETDNIVDDHRVVSSSSPRKRSGRKYRKSHRRSRSDKENGPGKSGTTIVSDKDGGNQTGESKVAGTSG
jgi:hypothetical protein